MVAQAFKSSCYQILFYCYNQRNSLDFKSRYLKFYNQLQIYPLKEMKQNTVFLGIVLGFLMLFTIASSNDVQCCNFNTIRVSGTGKVLIDADIAIIYAYITQDGATVEQALGKVNTILTAITTVLTQNNVTKDDITTSYISIYPKYDYSNGTGVIVGYTVYMSLTITIRGIDTNSAKIGVIIDGIANAGVSSISGITYDNSNPENGKTAARKLAFNDASNKAKQYAQLAGRKLGRIVIIDETNQAYYPYSSTSLSLQNNLGAPAAPTATPTEPQVPTGKITIIVNLILVFLMI